MEMTSKINCKAELSAVLIHADGTRKDLGVISKRDLTTWWKRLLDRLRRDERGIVTTAGVTYMASDFASGGATPTISGFKYHDCGTNTSPAEGIGNTALGTPWGGARVIGTPTNPTAQVYRSVATIAFNNTFGIVEWGLFSAATVGTLWDRRVFAAINVVNGDSIQFTYNLTVNSGGT
jgi:hypothetical protein